ncbi:lipase family protein [Butyrivibrio sp. AE2032]|uniref:lipase family protein n=1 Tax=Butyrivibrio sp. AE2032 TaxID=1458463 RepID=UPI0005591905|nr:hypothetical protein [Butyrivibrio sp. AE2032]
MSIKKHITFFLIIIFSLSLFACKNQEANEDSSPKRNLVTIKYNDNYDSGTAEVYWDSYLFEDDPSVFNLDLARTAAAISAASNDRSIGTAEFLADALHDSLGLEDICLYSYPNYKGSKALNMSTKDSDLSTAFAIGHQKMTSPDGKEFEIIVVVCRGTEGYQDSIFYDGLGSLLISSYSYDGFKSFYGYVDYATQIQNALVNYVNNYSGSFAADVKFLFTGHSLGGTPVQLLVADLQKYDKCAYGYTFGSLNATSEPYPDYYVWNIFNYYDDFGPNGSQLFKPSGGWYTYENKVGKILLFACDFDYVFTCDDGYYSHVMAGYYDALTAGFLDEKGNPTMFDSKGCFNLEGTWVMDSNASGGTLSTEITFNSDGSFKSGDQSGKYAVSSVEDYWFDLELSDNDSKKTPFRATIHTPDVIRLFYEESDQQVILTLKRKR